MSFFRLPVVPPSPNLSPCEGERDSVCAKTGTVRITPSPIHHAPQPRKIENSQRVIAAYERQMRRPMTTDFKTLTDAPWSNWNARGSSER